MTSGQCHVVTSRSKVTSGNDEQWIYIADANITTGMNHGSYLSYVNSQFYLKIGDSDPGQASTKNMISALPQCNTYCLYYIRITQTIDCCQRALDISLVRRGPKETSMAPIIRLCSCGITRDKYGYTAFSAFYAN